MMRQKLGIGVRFVGARTGLARTSRVGPLLLAATLAVTLASCTEDAKPSAPSVASVNGQGISLSDVNQALERFEATDQFDQLAEQSDPDSARRQYERMYVSQQIKRLVLSARAEALGIDVDEEVTKRVEETRSAYPSDKEFRDALSGIGYTVDEYTGLIKDQVLEEMLREETTADAATETKPSEQELKEYYRSNEDRYHQTQVRHILVDEMALARELSTTLQSSSSEERESLFAELARRHSSDTSNANQGGDLGWVSPGQLVESFTAAMDDLGIGEVSGPVRSDFGVHVILVTGRRVQSFEDVRDDIAQQFTDMAVGQAWSEWLQNAYKQADIDVNARYGKLDPASGQIVAASAK
jgi:foldase protein PrsA